MIQEKTTIDTENILAQQQITSVSAIKEYLLLDAMQYAVNIMAVKHM